MGVLRAVLVIPGARSLKDRRQVVNSVRDRLQHRFSVSVHVVGQSEVHDRQVLVVTTGGSEPSELRSVLDKVEAFLAVAPAALLSDCVIDVFRWHPGGAMDLHG